jgi:hypothetical protein
MEKNESEVFGLGLRLLVGPTFLIAPSPQTLSPLWRGEGAGMSRAVCGCLSVFASWVWSLWADSLDGWPRSVGRLFQGDRKWLKGDRGWWLTGGTVGDGRWKSPEVGQGR